MLTMSTRYLEAFKISLGHEGGYVNDPNDAGGETKYGISKRAYPHLDIKNLTLNDAREIYHRDYWRPIAGDFLPAGLALITFDAAINSGVRQGAMWTQRAIGAGADGQIGPRSIEAAKLAPPSAMRQAITLRWRAMSDFKSFRHHAEGWGVRLIELSFQAPIFDKADFS